MRGFCSPSWVYLLCLLNYLSYSSLCHSLQIWVAQVQGVNLPELELRISLNCNFYLLIFWSGYICVIMLIPLLLFCLPAQFSMFFCCEQAFCNTLAKYALYTQIVNLLFPLVIVSWREPKRAAELVVMHLDVPAFSLLFRLKNSCIKSLLNLRSCS